MDSKKLAINIRKEALVMTSRAKASHIGSVLSIADLLAVLYARVLKYKSDDPKFEGRDRFILSKGHAGAGVYVALAECGFFDKSFLENYYSKNGTSLSGHITYKFNPGVEFSTGSLGHGICVAVGMALAAKIDGKKPRIFTIVGNGECNEGSVWEAVMFAVHNRLDNLTIIVDNNKMQAMGDSKDILNMDNLAQRFEAFNAYVVEIDGHNHQQIYDALTKKIEDKPKVVVANTIKGKGVKFMENNIAYHYGYLNNQQLSDALKEVCL